MTVTINYCEQGTPEWYQARLGIPTASEFQTIMARGKQGGVSEGRKTYLLKLAGERLTGEPMDTYTNANMERGKVMEAEAREYYCLATDAKVEQVGFIRNGDKGGSPDALIGKQGMLEVKTSFPHLLIQLLLDDEAPNKYMAQVQGNLWVAERQWCDLIVYWPKVPALIKRIYRDDDYIRRLAEQVELFNNELQQTVDYIRKIGGRLAA